MLNSIGELHQCQYHSCDIVLPSYKTLPLGEMVKYTQDFSVLFLATACDSTEAATKLYNNHMVQNFTFTYTPLLIRAREAILSLLLPVFQSCVSPLIERV